jgi:hypothetical protein
MTLCVSCPEGHTVSIAAEKLGRPVACPCCFAVFRADLDLSAARQARKEEKKPRRSRDEDDDDDDEDEEVEKPRKKKPKPKAEETKKKDAKSTIKKARKKDEDEEDEEEEGDEEEEEPEIDWTPRKRQLSLCIVGLYITMGAFGTMIAFTVAVCLYLDYCTFEVLSGFQATLQPDKIQTDIISPGYGFASKIAGAFFALTQVILIVALFVNLTVPAKAEARGVAIAGLVFGFLCFAFGILLLLANSIFNDEARADNMVRLMGGAAGLCFVVSLMSTMAFQAKLMMFMNMKLEASQAVTNVGFYFIYLIAMFVVLIVSFYLCNYLHYLLGYVLIVAICAGAGMAGRMLFAQIALMNKMRHTILKYIREAI